MALYVYRISNGSLFSWSPDDGAPVASDAQLADRGLAKVTGLASLDDTHAWDAATKTVIVVAAPTQVRSFSVFDWMDRFTPAELAAIRASSNAGVQKFLFMLPLASNQRLDLNDPRINTVMIMLVNLNLLTQGRANAIMS